MTKTTRKSVWPRSLAALVAPFVVAGGANAAIELRVESRPNSGPIDAFVRVSDGNGSIAGLEADDFAVTLDGAPLNSFALGMPPDQDSARKISVVIVYRAITPAPGVVTAIEDFINQMVIGDYAALVRFQNRLQGEYENFLHEFTAIDGGSGSGSLIEFLQTPGFLEPKGLHDALALALTQFATPTVALPDGPKAVILIDHVTGSFSGVSSQSDLVAAANANGIPLFVIQVGDAFPVLTAKLTAFSADTGATHFTAVDEAEIAEAMAHVAALLEGEYQLTIPQIAVTDCNPHMLEVTAEGESASTEFIRCDTTPEAMNFGFLEGVSPGTVVTSNGSTIASIESPVTISVIGGEYAIGSPATFTSAPGIVQPGDQIFVRHVTPAGFGMNTTTALIAGGVPSFFSSLTMNQPQQPGGGGGGGGNGGDGGGGTTGVPELLLLLGALFARRYFWRTYSPGASPSGG